jgi:hypothetical protein
LHAKTPNANATRWGKVTKRVAPQRRARGVATAAPNIVPRGNAAKIIPIWESEMDIERAAAGKKEDGSEKMAHCVIITSDIRNMNLKNRGQRLRPLNQIEVL